MSKELYGENYYLRGKQFGLSNYENYRWLPDQTISMVTHLKRYLRIADGDRVLDVGCALGNYVRALRMIGVEAYGYDISEWAVTNADPEVRPFLSNHLNGAEFDEVYMKDVGEHIAPDELRSLLQKLLARTRKRLFLIVPLAIADGGPYIHPKEENDPTHVNRWTLPGWLRFLQSCSQSFVASGSYRYPGLKPGAYEVDNAYGFLMLERI